MSELVLVFTHFADRELAQRAARKMIRSHLAASVQIAPLEKIHYWRGEWRQDTKWTLGLMTTKSRYRALEAALRAMHPDEEEEPPPIYGAACDRALPVYADWVRDRVMDSESASGVRPSQALNFYDTNPPSSIPPEE